MSIPLIPGDAVQLSIFYRNWHINFRHLKYPLFNFHNEWRTFDKCIARGKRMFSIFHHTKYTQLCFLSGLLILLFSMGNSKGYVIYFTLYRIKKYSYETCKQLKSCGANKTIYLRFRSRQRFYRSWMWRKGPKV
jgi:hypothetical protein